MSVWVTRRCYGPVRGWCEGEFNKNFLYLQYSESFCLGNFISMMFSPAAFFFFLLLFKTFCWSKSQEDASRFFSSGCADGELTLIYTLWFPPKLPSLFIQRFFFLHSVCFFVYAWIHVLTSSSYLWYITFITITNGVLERRPDAFVVPAYRSIVILWIMEQIWTRAEGSPG